MAKVKAARPDVEIALFGCENLPDYRLPFEHTDLGEVPNERLRAVYNTASIVLDLSDYQALGRIGLEGMACGAATVLTKFGGITEYIRDGENTLAVDPEDEAGIVTAVLRLVEDAELRARLVSRGTPHGRAFLLRRRGPHDERALRREPRLREWPAGGVRPGRRRVHASELAIQYADLRPPRSPARGGTQGDRPANGRAGMAFLESIGGMLGQLLGRPRQISEEEFKTFRRESFDPVTRSGACYVPMQGYESTVHYRDKQNLHHLGRYEWAARVLGQLPQRSRVLDCACGVGYGSRKLAEIFGRVDAVDVFEDAIQMARERYDDSRIVWHCLDAAKLREAFKEALLRRDRELPDDRVDRGRQEVPGRPEGALEAGRRPARSIRRCGKFGSIARRTTTTSATTGSMIGSTC